MSVDATAVNRRAVEKAGVLYGIAAYGFWGVIPVFWKQLQHVAASETLAHRVVWGLLAFCLLTYVSGRVADVKAAVADRKTRLTLLCSGLLLGGNWLVFIHAVNTGRVLHASLGYFITPIISVVLGMVVLKERPSATVLGAVALGAVGVALLSIDAGGVPWISLVLAASFGTYGLLRKTVRADALPGSTLELIYLAPAALAYLGWLASQGRGELVSGDATTWLLLVLTGPITAAPLLWFSNAARRVTLTTLGFLQYLAPIGQFLLAVVVYREHFGAAQLSAFACIWLALAIFTISSVRASRLPAR